MYRLKYNSLETSIDLQSGLLDNVLDKIKAKNCRSGSVCKSLRMKKTWFPFTLCTCALLLSLCTGIEANANAPNVFELVGLFTTVHSDPFISEAYGIYPREAARLAVEHVREEGLLDEYNYQLKLFEVSTVCDQTGAVIATLEFARVTGKLP